MTEELIHEVFLPAFGMPTLEDSAVLDFAGPQLAFTTDSYVVKPYFFPGGDIGKLAVCGTVNDLAVQGARPLWLSVGLILEEGLPITDLRKIVGSMAETARVRAAATSRSLR